MIDDKWTPTPDNVNALPHPLRKYIHDLETLCDPAGMVRENVLVREENEMLRAKLAEEVAYFALPEGDRTSVCGQCDGKGWVFS